MAIHPSTNGHQEGGEASMEAIAIVGMSARLPQQAASMDKFWSMLCEGRRARTEVPADRINMDAFYHPANERTDTTNVRHGNFLEGDIGAFDAPFFSIQPNEAISMDPQQRILLETSYRALENAGIPMEKAVKSQTGVFIAASSRDYEVIMYRDPEMAPKYMGTGIGTSLLGNRISWFFDFLGPSITVDTACSGSLTAVHMACQSLWNGESRMALVGGVSLVLAPEASLSQLSTLGFLSPDGISYSFDSRANGYAKGEGCGMVVLKRMEDAIRDGDTIRAVIRATSINQDGRTPGITQPSKRAQTENIQQAYREAGLSLDQTRYFEAHGTGTALGDPFEAEAIYGAFQRTMSNPLYIGALKANIGHLEAAAGIAALMKTILMLENGVIPPIAGLETINPNIPAAKWGLEFPRTTVPFLDNIRRVSINSFGYGGSNAHAIIDDAASYLTTAGLRGRHTTKSTSASTPEGQTGSSNGHSETQNCTNGHSIQLNGHSKLTNGHNNGCHPINGSAQSSRPAVLLLSAADEAGIERAAKAYEEYFSGAPHRKPRDEQKYLEDLAFTLSSRRSNLPWKAFAVVDRLPRTEFARSFSKPIRSSATCTISYVFTGQGAQWASMGRGLTTYRQFYDSLLKSEKYLRDAGCKWSVIDELHKDADLSRVDEPEFAQTLCTALQIALVELLASWDIRPRAVVGHSSGEIAAAYCIGGLTHASAIRVAWYRGLAATTIASKHPGAGAMLAVALSEVEVTPYLDEAMRDGGRISVGCVNAPNSVTITGDVTAIDELKRLMDAKGTFARKLQVSVAYHSHHMEELATWYKTNLEGIEGDDRTGSVMYSSVTADHATAKQVSQPEYWVANLVSKVRFAEAASSMATYLMEQRTDVEKDILLELGPHGALQRPTKDIIKAVPRSKNLLYDSLLTRDRGSHICLAAAMGRLRCEGYPIDLSLVSSPDEAELQALTDLPPYEFHHTQAYWTESRLSTAFRFREQIRHELLGLRETDWNPLQPKWRNVIRMNEHPWIHDHQFDGVTLYPAAGMLVMAIEAARQLASSEPTGYNLSNIRFPGAFVAPADADMIEAHISFSPQASGYSFRIFAIDTEWSEICSGDIIAEIQSTPTAKLQAINLSEVLHEGFNSRWETTPSSRFYDNLQSYGYGLSRTFQTLGNLRFTDDGKASASVIADDWQNKVDKAPRIASHVIHPTDLDGIFQSSVVVYSQGGNLRVPVIIPTQIDSLWIAGIGAGEAGEMRLLTKSTFSGFRDSDYNMGVVDKQNQPRIIVEGFRQTVLEQAMHEDKNPIRNCYFTKWRPDIELCSPEEITSICCADIDPSTIQNVETVDCQELVSLYYMGEIAKMPIPNLKQLPTHLQKYVRWAQQNFNVNELARLRASHPSHEMLFHDETRDKFLSTFAKDCAHGALLQMVGTNLTRILNGELDPLQLLFGGENLLDKFYSSAPFDPNFKRLTSYLDLLAHKIPNMNILEVGAGTGSLTAHILQRLTGESGDLPRLSNLTFTDISTGYFEEAKARFHDLGEHVKYAAFNVEKDPLDQGFEEAQFDAVAASLVLHATTNVATTLRNLRKVLKPGGKLLLFEATAPEKARMTAVFGLLPGWWLSEESEREWSPLLDHEGWNRVLRDNGFSDLEVILPDHTDAEYRTYSGLVATAVEPQPRRDMDIVILGSGSLANELADKLKPHQVTILAPGELCSYDFSGKNCISLIEMDKSFFDNIDEMHWTAFKKAVLVASSILWVAQGCGMDGSQPSRAMVKGLGRAIHSENQEANFVELSLESGSVDYILQAFWQSFNPYQRLLESEFMEIDHQLCIPRVDEAKHVNRQIHNASQSRSLIRQNFAATRPLQLTVTAPGLFESLCFDDDPLYDLPLGESEIEIEVRAAGLGEDDVQNALGKLAGDALGTECAGIVTRVGSKAAFQPGEFVCACTVSGSHKNFVRTDSSTVARIPKNVNFSEAAGIPMAFATALYAFQTADLQAEESVLVHKGYSSLGQAAIQCAQNVGAHVYATVEKEGQRQHLSELYSLPTDHIYCGDFAGSLQLQTGGVDLVLTQDTAVDPTYVAPLGRIVEVCLGSKPSYSPASPARSDISVHRIHMKTVIERARPRMKSIMARLSTLLETNAVRVAQPVHVTPVSQVMDAFRTVRENQGKHILDMSNGGVVPALPSRRPAYCFELNATYVIAGGLGGLGRSMVEWMADRNARNFLLLSRSGAEASDAGRELIADLAERGVRIHAPRCDITDEQRVAEVFKDCTETMPPIKGCIQAAMVLKDGLMEKMTAKDVHDCLRPKTYGTVHLERYMPSNLSFFVILSSIAGMTGSRGQANYAMANTFQDAFARSRAAKGQHCISLNLGSIMSVGFAAERDLTAMLYQNGFKGVAKNEFFALLDWACNPSNPAARDPAAAQITIGLAGAETLTQEEWQGVYWTSKPIFKPLSVVNALSWASQSEDEDSKPKDDWVSQMTATSDELGAKDVALSGLMDRLARLLAVPVADIDPVKSIHSFGIDSLISLEMRQWVLKNLGADTSVFDLMQTRSIDEYAGIIARKSKLTPATTPTASAAA